METLLVDISLAEPLFSGNFWIGRRWICGLLIVKENTDRRSGIVIKLTRLYRPEKDKEKAPCNR
jgi:hypothetical protein